MVNESSPERKNVMQRMFSIPSPKLQFDISITAIQFVIMTTKILIVLSAQIMIFSSFPPNPNEQEKLINTINLFVH